MRAGVFALVALGLSACGGDDSSGMCMYAGQTWHVGDRFASTDGCNSCSCTSSGVACTELACVPSDGGVDADPMFCGPTNGCPVGPACGAVCCGQGERCEDGVCKCNKNPACTSGNTCEAAGPVGGDSCGSICCGASGPCPL